MPCAQANAFIYPLWKAPIEDMPSSYRAETYKESYIINLPLVNIEHLSCYLTIENPGHRENSEPEEEVELGRRGDLEIGNMLSTTQVASVRYGAGRGGLCPWRPHHYTGPGGVFCAFSPPRPRPGPTHTHSLDRPPFFTSKSSTGAWLAHGWRGPCPGVGAGKGEKSAPPRSGEPTRAGNFAESPCFMGPQRPRNEHYKWHKRQRELIMNQI